MTGLPFEIWDVFTFAAYAGNQLAVVWGAEGLPDPSLQAIAREFNFSETVFILPPQGDEAVARLRIFTPTLELGFAGHPTIGGALALKNVESDSFMLEEGAGPVAITLSGTGRARKASFVPPQKPNVHLKGRADLSGICGLPGSFDYQISSAGTPFGCIQLPDAAAVDAASPGHGLGAFLSGDESVGLYLFAQTGANTLYARLFACEAGVIEDPATGSAAAALVAVLRQQGLSGDFVIHQGVHIGRPSQIGLSFDKETCAVSGQGVKVMAGTLETLP